MSMVQKHLAVAATIMSLALFGFSCTPAKIYTATSVNGADAMVREISITPGQKIGPAPIKVTGEAKGNYYFEASFPIKLTDTNGKVLGQGIAKAQGDWMTENFVPFVADFSFSPATTTEGVLILQRDNPSGMPENDASYSIPVLF